MVIKTKGFTVLETISMIIVGALINSVAVLKCADVRKHWCIVDYFV